MTVTFHGDGPAVTEQQQAFESLCTDHNIAWRGGRSTLTGRHSRIMSCDYVFPDGQDLPSIWRIRASALKRPI